jgi:hypothetical protein
VIRQALGFLRHNPWFLFQSARNAARLELSIPLELLRWGIDKRPRGRGPDRIEISEVDSQLHVELTVDLFGTKIDVSSNITVEAIENEADSLRLALRVRDLAIDAPPDSPAAQMVAAMDLSQPGELMAMMPQKHNDLLESSGDRIVIDLLKLRPFRKNRALRRILGAVSFVGVRGVRIENDVLVIGFSVRPTAIPAAVKRARDA